MTRKQRHIAILIAFWTAVIAVPAVTYWRLDHQQTLNRQLIAAIKRDDEPAALRALDQGADANARDEPPIAVKDLIWNLLRGQRPKPSDAPTALLVLLGSEHAADPGSADLPDRPNLVRALIAHRARLDATDDRGLGPLYYAFYNRLHDSVRLLIGNGADVHLDITGTNPLVYAIAYSNPVDIVELMLQHGADPNSKGTSGGVTPLDIAIALDSPASVACLLRHHANPNQRSWSDPNSTPKNPRPLELAKRYNRAEIVKLLRAAGAK